MTGTQFTRRSFLILGSSAVLLAGCTPAPAPTTTPTPIPPPSTRGVRDLLALSTFVVAHRGSGDNWPEHTLTAYRNGLAAGADAVEISLCATSDGVLVCHHDLSAKRVLGVDRLISEMTWAEVSALSVDARTWLGEQTPLEPVSRFEDVLGALGPDVLVFVEDKQGTNTKAILDVLDAQPRAAERFVWKQWAPAAQVAAAKERGYLAWGYFDEAQADRLDEFAATFDLLGLPVASSDDLLTRAVATGTPVMCWEVHFHDDRTRLVALGVKGLMVSNVGYLLRTGSAASDDFASGRRAAGDLPSQLESLGWAAQPALVAARSAVRIQRGGVASYLMGSLADPGRALQEASATIVWPDTVPADGTVGLAFGLTGDAQGGDGERGKASGYEVHIAPAGTVSLNARQDGAVVATLASGVVTAPTVGTALRLVVRREGDALRVRINDADVLTVTDARWRGPWLRLFKSYESPVAVEFSAVRATLA